MVNGMSKTYGEKKDKTVHIVSLANLEINDQIFQTDNPVFSVFIYSYTTGEPVTDWLQCPEPSKPVSTMITTW